MALVLAAGGGTRFRGDRHKLLVELDGRAIVGLAVQAALDAEVGPVVAVTGAVALDDVLPPDVELVHNPRWADGIATSLQVGLAVARATGCEAVVVGLGDQPAVEPDAWRRVAAAAGGPIVAATYHGRRGNPVRLDRPAWPLLPTTGDEGARALMRDRPDLVTAVACEGDPHDVDTVEDLGRWS